MKPYYQLFHYIPNPREGNSSPVYFDEFPSKAEAREAVRKYKMDEFLILECRVVQVQRSETTEVA